MATPRITRANEIATLTRAMLAAEGLDKVTVTLDPLAILSGSRHGVIVISPPDLTFPTFEQTGAAWELSAIAGPADNMLAAWETLDAILEALRTGGLDMATARGDMFAPQHGSPLPGYTITLNPDLIID